MSLHTSPGVAAALALCASSALGASFAFVRMVGRARRALDFAVTVFTLHLICCTLYGGLPRTALWYGLNTACLIAMTVVCEALSRRIELREIAVFRGDDAPHEDDHPV